MSKYVYSGAMCEGNPQYPFLHDLSKRIEAITKFKVWPVQDIASSECFEVNNALHTGYNCQQTNYLLLYFFLFFPVNRL